jgi:hypothetical protein
MPICLELHELIVCTYGESGNSLAIKRSGTPISRCPNGRRIYESIFTENLTQGMRCLPRSSWALVVTALRD